MCEAAPATRLARPHPSQLCPECQNPGKSVQGQTVKALLNVSLRMVVAVPYLFCPAQACPIVYFASDGSHTFTTDQLRERVYQKEPEAAEVFVCYCFRHTISEVRAAGADAAAIIADVNTGIQAGQCACDLRNPQGSCCLGNLRGLAKRLAQSAGELIATDKG